MFENTLYDVIIVGAGPAGTAAAMKLSGLKVAMLDVGYKPEQSNKFRANFYDIMRHPADFVQALIGENCERMEGIFGRYIMPKIKAPLQRYITRDHDRFGRLLSESFQGVVSYAQGGMANAWGAQMLRYLNPDLIDFPISETDLSCYYDELTDEIGIAGDEDDLTRFYGSTKGLLPPVTINRNSQVLYQRYLRLHLWFNRRYIYIGHPRAAILTKAHAGRPAHSYLNLEFFQPQINSIYNPVFTLERLIQNGKLYYFPKHHVTGFVEDGQEVKVTATNLENGHIEVFRGKKLFIAAGTINSTRLVAHSLKAYHTPLPIMENLLSYIPFINPFMLGVKQETQSIYSQLNIGYDGDENYQFVMGSFYAVSGLLTSDFLVDIPFSIKSNIDLLKWILPSMLVLHLWYPASTNKQRNYLTVDEQGDIHIHYADHLDGRVERHIIRILALIGYISFPSLCKFPLPGNSFHYAGTMPMRISPEPFETYQDGRLFGANRVHVIDGAIFPSLSAKNLSFTIMANAMRIADMVRRQIWTY